MIYLVTELTWLILAQLLLIENAPEKPRLLEDNEVDMCQFTALGGVYHLDILELPPQCKSVKGWMIMEVGWFLNQNLWVQPFLILLLYIKCSNI